MSSLVFLAFSIILFFVIYGVMFTLLPMILGQFFSVADDLVTPENMDADWITTYNETEGTVQWLVPLVPTIGIFVAVIKILMVASARGRE